MFHESGGALSRGLALENEDHILCHHDLVSVVQLLEAGSHFRRRELGDVGVRVHLRGDVLDGQALGVAREERI